jgi:hypothetical protein
MIYTSFSGNDKVQDGCHTVFLLEIQNMHMVDRITTKNQPFGEAGRRFSSLFLEYEANRLNNCFFWSSFFSKHLTKYTQRSCLDTLQIGDPNLPRNETTIFDSVPWKAETQLIDCFLFLSSTGQTELDRMEQDTYPMLLDRERTLVHQWLEQGSEGPVCKTRALLLLTCLVVVVVAVYLALLKGLCWSVICAGIDDYWEVSSPHHHTYISTLVQNERCISLCASNHR